MKNILTTVPKGRFVGVWADAEAELLSSDGEKGGFWTVATNHLPKELGVTYDIPDGMVCFMLFDGLIRGYMDIIYTDLAEHWPYHSESAGGKASYVFVLANWHSITPIPMTGFQGWRYTDMRP